MSRLHTLFSALTILGVLLAIYLLNLMLHLMRDKPDFAGQSFSHGGVTTERLVDEPMADFKLRHEEAEASFEEDGDA